MQDLGDHLALRLMGGFEAGFLLSILNASQDCVKLIEPDGALAFMNVNGMCAMEIDSFDTIAGSPWPDLWPDSIRPMLYDALDRARRGERVGFEAQCPTARGTDKWWHVSVVPIRNTDGHIHKILAASRDITERVLREREQAAYTATLKRELDEKSDLLTQRDFLMREIDHRVKNSLAQVAAILRLQARRASDTVRAALEEAARRVGAIARVHEQLQFSGDSKTISVVPLLDRLCKEFTLSLDRTVTFTADTASDLPMMSERATALSIIVSELVANGVRHGTGSAPVTVRLGETACGASVTVINASERSKGDADQPTTGLGTTICETYAATLGGALDWSFADGNVTATLIFKPAENECLR